MDQARKHLKDMEGHPKIAVRLEERRSEEVAEGQGKKLYRLLQ